MQSLDQRLESWVLQWRKTMKKEENVRQIHDASYWHDYESLKQATDETWERSDMSVGLGKRSQ